MATVGVIAVLVMLVAAWAVANRATVAPPATGDEAAEGKRGGCASGVCPKPAVAVN